MKKTFTNIVSRKLVLTCFLLVFTVSAFCQTSGSAGGSGFLPTVTFIDGQYGPSTNFTSFTTTKANVTITSIDYTIPAWQAVNGLVISIYNSAGTRLATSSTNTTTNNSTGSPIKITNIFNYKIVAAGSYTIRASTGWGNIGGDNPSYPLTEPTGTINITGNASGGYRCFNNIQFTITSPPPTISGVSAPTCVGGSTGAITATAASGTTPYTFSLNGGAYQSAATFTGLAAGNYTLTVKDNSGQTASTSVTVNPYATATDNQNAAATDSWIGHMYDGTNFSNYIGQFTETETFDQSFGGSTTCFNVISNSQTRSIYTETYSVKYRMNSTKKGLYVVDLGSDDGSRLTVDGTMVYNNWSDQSFLTKSAVLISLKGNSSLLYEYYENGGSNRVIFQNLRLVLANTLSTNTTQTFCTGSTGATISGDAYGTLPAGISLTGTGYQWSYSTTPGGTRTNIAGATGATFTPSTAVAPFNTPGTYYVYRNAAISSTNNIAPNPFTTSSESNAAVVTVTTAPAASISYAGSPYCSSSGTAVVTLTGTTGGSFSAPAGLSINAATGAVNLAASTAGTYTVTYTVNNAGGCTASASASITITTQPWANGNYSANPYCSNGGIVYPAGSSRGAPGTFSAPAGLSINATTGAVNLGSSTPGNYIVTYAVPASGGCTAYSNTSTITISAAPSATIAYAASPYCSDAGTAIVTRTGTAGGTFTSAAGLALDATTGKVTLPASTPGTYSVIYRIDASEGCAAFQTTTNIGINAAPVISQIPSANLIGYYKFEENSNDVTGNNNGALQSSPAQTADRFNNADKALSFNGSNQYVSTANAYSNPADFSISIWFKTGTTSGGKLIGFGNAQTGLSGQYDRHIYMNDAGQLYFGVYPGTTVTINSTTSYNDNKWHLATATLSSATGMALYVDGVMIASNTNNKTAESYTGYWKIGGDKTSGWPSSSSSNYFNGVLDDALIYQRSLTALEVAVLYASPDGAGNNGPVCVGSPVTLSSSNIPGAAYAWTGPNGFTASSANSSLTYTAAAAGTYKVQVTANGCAAVAFTNVVPSANPGKWTGYAGTNWKDGNNWCSGTVPDATTDVTIAGSLTNYPLISTGSNPANNLTISNGASLTLSNAALQISGVIVNNGTFNASNGTVEMTGSSTQAIRASTFAGNTIKNLTLNNAAGVNLNGSLNVTGVLLASKGQFNANGYLTLVSTAAQTALIDGSGAGEVVGNLTMQRYLASGFGYKYFSSPFKAATVGEFAEEVNLRDSFPSFYRYDENVASAGWINYTNSAGLLNPLQGYAVNLGSSAAPKTVSITGVVNNHSVSLPSLYNHNKTYTLGFNLVGNPYPSPVDWDISAGWNRTKIDNAIYYFNAGTTDRYTGIYSSYINGVSSDGVANNIIPAMQGFFIHVSDGAYPVAASLSVNNTARVSNRSATFHRGGGSIDNPALLRISAGFTEEEYADPVVFYFDEEATLHFDKSLDALKLMNTNERVPNLYAVSPEAAKLSINAISLPANSTTIPLGLKTEKEGRILFNAVDIAQIPEGLHIYLKDAETKTLQDLQQQPAYTVNLPAGKYENRFSIIFSKTDLLKQSPADSTSPNTPAVNPYSIYSYGKKLFVSHNLTSNEKGNLLLYNLAGQMVWKQEMRGTGKEQFEVPFSNGIYIAVFYTDDKQVFSKKLLIGN